MAFIRLANLIINTDCVATVKLNTYRATNREEEIPIVNICLMLPEYSVDGGNETNIERFNSIENLEFEGELALVVWNYFVTSKMVHVLFE